MSGKTSRARHLKWRLITVPSLLLLGIAIPWAQEELPLLLNPPSPEIVQLATAAGMTPEAQKLFYRQQPKIQAKPIFAQSCQQLNRTADEIVAVGCYRTTGQLGRGESGEIFIQSIVDPRFSGIMEVTAAHEMLHAVYARLSDAERNRLAPQLQQAAKLIKDERLASIFKRYQEKDLQLYYNELHSHLGTELADLGNPELEKHYSRYFSNRLQLVALADRSQTPFRQIDTKAQFLEAQINALEANLKSGKQALIATEKYLKDAREDLNAQKYALMNIKVRAETADNTTFSNLVREFESSKARFNNGVNRYNARVRGHQRDVDSFNQQVEIYKRTVTEYNALAKEERSLLNELKATPQEPIPANIYSPAN